MRAALFETFGGDITVKNVPDPTPMDSGVVIKVLANGVCRSDWHGWVGHDDAITLPHVPGHECCGEIVAVGNTVSNWREGDRVIVPFSGGCGVCPTCKDGNEHICDDDFQPGFSGWGAFAEYCAIDYADTNLVRLPEAMEPTTAASLGCRFMTSFRAMTIRGAIKEGDWVAIHGCGGIGLSSMMIAKALGANIIAIDISEVALNEARRLGAAQMLNAADVHGVAEAIIELTKGGADVSVDALGSPVTAYNSIACLKKRGKHIQIGLAAGDAQDMSIPMNLVIARELDILGSHGMQAHAYGPMLEMITSGKLAPEQLIGSHISLEEGAKTLMEMDTNPPKGLAVIDRF